MAKHAPIPKVMLPPSLKGLVGSPLACMKIGYRFENDADCVARRHGARVYHCPKCSLFHLTSDSPTKGKV